LRRTLRLIEAPNNIFEGMLPVVLEVGVYVLQFVRNLGKLCRKEAWGGDVQYARDSTNSENNVALSRGYVKETRRMDIKNRRRSPLVTGTVLAHRKQVLKGSE
jgi:hypothetical protein